MASIKLLVSFSLVNVQLLPPVHPPQFISAKIGIVIWSGRVEKYTGRLHLKLRARGSNFSKGTPQVTNRRKVAPDSLCSWRGRREQALYWLYRLLVKDGLAQISDPHPPRLNLKMAPCSPSGLYRQSSVICPDYPNFVIHNFIILLCITYYQTQTVTQASAI